jgi:hypothetical protein
MPVPNSSGHTRIAIVDPVCIDRWVVYVIDVANQQKCSGG